MVTEMEQSLKILVDAVIQNEPLKQTLSVLPPDAVREVMIDCGILHDARREPHDMGVEEIAEKHADILRMMYRGKKAQPSGEEQSR